MPERRFIAPLFAIKGFEQGLLEAFFVFGVITLQRSSVNFNVFAQYWLIKIVLTHLVAFLRIMARWKNTI
jgi:hypothetical protein